MPPRTIKRYVLKVLNFGEVKANTIERPINSVAMHPHVELLITEAVAEFILETNYPSRRIIRQTDNSSKYKSEDEF